ncbi:LOW QUALITY PROTEIN: kinesin-like protein KIF12 [Diaphorina citri]|uniref:Kinesin-like protein n=1 Tax=Diaphorina citri TaxID=121845 RepID=A0A3Q0IY25_DIACI|nr:LOW QUALITY PROTEIN: kinesin-like protein KIF12 [Diaphorina citri]
MARSLNLGSIASSDSDKDSPEAKQSVPEDNINVVIRCRPLSKKEIDENDPGVVQFPGGGQILVSIKCSLSKKEIDENDPGVVQFPGGGQILLSGLDSIIHGDNGPKTKQFSFNVVFEPRASQPDVFLYSGMTRLVQMAIEGFSTTCFCYGQTGSGKTHTLTGPPGMKEAADPFHPDHGIIFRSFLYLFSLLQGDRQDIHYVLKVDFLEIYNEKVIDLLNNTKRSLPVRWSKKSRSFFVENLFTVDCEELDDLLAVLEEGMRNRAIGAHNMNEHSSRSHTMLTINITSEQLMDNGVYITKSGKINFVDLAGSEMTKKTHSEGKTLREANNINKSLMVLGYCISSLSDPKKRTGHIPYRDSKLTKLLADSLAGSGVTLMIATISPARSNISETLNTLRYAARAKRIRTKPIIVMDPREALILSLKREVAALQSENEHLRTALQLEEAGHTLDEPRRPRLKTPPTLDLSRIARMDRSELSELVSHYAKENEALRQENAELFTSRDLLVRDQELVCRENERLLHTLEELASGRSRADSLPASRSSSSTSSNDRELVYSPGGSVLQGPRFKPEIVGNKEDPKPPHRLPESIQKELDKRRIGK